MKKFVFLYLVTILQLCMLLGTALNSSANALDYNALSIGATAGGNFFIINRVDGKIYLYNNDLSRCFAQYQFDGIGKPIIQIQ